MKISEIGIIIFITSLVNILFSLPFESISPDFLIGSLIGGVLIFVAGFFIDPFLKVRKEILASEVK